MTPSSSSLKFRPSLSLDEIHTILAHVPPSNTELIRKLEVFTLKAKHGITRASHVSLPKQSLGASLGMEPDQSITELLELWNNPDTRSILSSTQLARVQYHRYTNDMMTPEEEKEYERVAN